MPTPSDKHPITIDQTKEQSPVIISEETTKKQSAGTSSQMQLLGLARQFAIDGGINKSDKQLPVVERAAKRHRIDDARKQLNLENIIQKAIALTASDQVTDRADTDWFASFINLAENVSNKTMQELWAKILAGEVNQPGSFSLRTLKVFKNMSINDAKLLSKAASLAVQDSKHHSAWLISGVYQKPSLWNIFDKQRQQRTNLAHFGLSYADLLTLADNDLLFIQETETNPLGKGDSMQFDYNGVPLSLNCNRANCSVNFYKFTPIGLELISLIANNPNHNFLEHLKQVLAHHIAIAS